eukprot:c36029_g1_i1 orf=33-182(+)
MLNLSEFAQQKFVGFVGKYALSLQLQSLVYQISVLTCNFILFCVAYGLW